MVSTGFFVVTMIARFLEPTCDQSGVDRTQVGPMLVPWTFAFWEVILVDGKQIVLEGIFCVKGIDTAVS